MWKQNYPMPPRQRKSKTPPLTLVVNSTKDTHTQCLVHKLSDGVRRMQLLLIRFCVVCLAVCPNGVALWASWKPLNPTSKFRFSTNLWEWGHDTSSVTNVACKDMYFHRYVCITLRVVFSCMRSSWWLLCLPLARWFRIGALEESTYWAPVYPLPCMPPKCKKYFRCSSYLRYNSVVVFKKSN